MLARIISPAEDFSIIRVARKKTSTSAMPSQNQVLERVMPIA
jgi:hypothetical protein